MKKLIIFKAYNARIIQHFFSFLSFLAHDSFGRDIVETPIGCGRYFIL